MGGSSYHNLRGIWPIHRTLDPFEIFRFCDVPSVWLADILLVFLIIVPCFYIINEFLLTPEGMVIWYSQSCLFTFTHTRDDDMSHVCLLPTCINPLIYCSYVSPASQTAAHRIPSHMKLSEAERGSSGSWSPIIIIISINSISRMVFPVRIISI